MVIKSKFNSGCIVKWNNADNGKPDAPFPSSADIRVKTFMHAENFYDSDDPDDKVLVLVDQLIKGTQIESCDTRQYRILTQRVLDRISFLAKKLWDKSFVEHSKLGMPQKTEDFRAYWDNRQSYWKSSLTSDNQALQSKRNADIYDMDTVPANDGLSTTLSAKAPSKVHRLKASRKVSHHSDIRMSHVSGSRLISNRFLSPPLVAG